MSTNTGRSSGKAARSRFLKEMRMGNAAVSNEAKPARVRMENITKSFGAVQSLRGANLEVAPGEVLGLVGENGAGKSTVPKELSSAIIPDTARIQLDET